MDLVKLTIIKKSRRVDWNSSGMGVYAERIILSEGKTCDSFLAYTISSLCKDMKYPPRRDTAAVEEAYQMVS